MLVNKRLSAPCYRPQALASNLAKSPNFPITPGAFQPTRRGSVDAFVSKLALTTGPLLTLELNQAIFRKGEQLTLRAVVTPGPDPVTADAYVALRLPDGTLLFLQLNGSLTTATRPARHA